ncbi:SpoIIE family protein phosphatase [Streptomyces sp. NPDC046977]|uniref:SpoIIE family protein phosphatase n=1 Tax=Streptomyces sp. NPDC046977 TaxID=3154703 RepID=UPI0033D8A219
MIELEYPHYETLSDTESGCVAIALVDATGTVAGWTRAARRLAGYSAAEVVGHPAADVFLAFPQDGSDAAAFLEQHRARNNWYGRAVVRHRDGSEHDVSLRFSLLAGRDGEFMWLVSATDIDTLSSQAVSGSVRESLLTRGPMGIILRDPELRCIFVNDAMERQDGVSSSQRLRHQQIRPNSAFESDILDEVMRKVTEGGVPVVHTLQAAPPGSRNTEHTFFVTFCRIEGARGEILGICCMSVDMTRIQWARERLAILSEASIHIGSTLDVAKTGQELTDLAVPHLADCAIAYVSDSMKQGPVPLGPDFTSSLYDSSLRQVGLTSIHKDGYEEGWEIGETLPVTSYSPIGYVMSSGRSYLASSVGTALETWLSKIPVYARKVCRCRVRSLMIVPIQTRQVLLGLAVFLRCEDVLPFEEDDLLLAEELVSRVALALDNARRSAREHTAGLDLQQNLLPQNITGGPAFEVASRYLPADTDEGVGGDWFDVIPLSGARVGLVVGDVVGHGIKAAATMGRLRTAVHTLANMDLPPDELLAHLDDMVQRLAEEDTDPQGLSATVIGATCLYAIYDPLSRRCKMARAGHPPPAIISPDGHVSFPDLPAGVPLGLGMDFFDAVEMEIPEGSLLAFYTDGLIESRDHDIDVGMGLLARALAHRGYTLDQLCTHIIDTVPTHAPFDDVTLLLTRTRSLGPGQSTSWDLATDPAVVSTARKLVSDQLTKWGIEHMTPTTQLIVSELVTNAIRHGEGPINLRLIKHQELTCEVWDSGNCVPRLHHPRTTDENGRGLLLVARTSHRWGTRHTTQNKIVWAEQTVRDT